MQSGPIQKVIKESRILDTSETNSDFLIFLDYLDRAPAIVEIVVWLIIGALLWQFGEIILKWFLGSKFSNFIPGVSKS